MKFYMSGTYRVLYYLKDGQLYQLPYWLKEFNCLPSGIVDTETHGTLAIVKGRTREATHNRMIKKHLEQGLEVGATMTDAKQRRTR